MNENNCINVLSEDFKISLHEYNPETREIGCQCSEKVYPDKIMYKSERYNTYGFNLLALATMASIFEKDDLLLLYRILDNTVTIENGTYISAYVSSYDNQVSKVYEPCNIFELAELLSVKYEDVKRIVDILLRDKAIYEYECYTDRFHTIKNKCYFFDSNFMYSECSWFRKEDFECDENGIILWYQSLRYDKEYQENPQLFNQKCRDGWRGEIDDGIGRDSIEYRKWKKDVLERDSNTCQVCGSTLSPEVHHILPYATHKELRTDVKNGITLCECCHSAMILGGFHQTYGTRNNTKEQLQEYIDNKREELGLPKIMIEDVIK